MTILTMSTVGKVVFEKEQFLTIDLVSGECVAEDIKEAELLRMSGDGIELDFKDELSRQKLTQKKLKALNNILPIISLIPTIKMVAVTGSLSMENARSHDDVDIMLITSSHTLWLTRPLLYILLKTLRLRRPSGSHGGMEVSGKICDNLWLDMYALEVPKFKQNLYTAHEVLQVRPVLDRSSTYQQFLNTNSWTKTYLANAYHHLAAKTKKTTRSTTMLSKLLSWLNSLSFALQYLYMRKKLTSEHVTLHSAYFHPKTISPEV